MAEHVDDGNKTQEQIEDEAWACFRLRAEGYTPKEIGVHLRLSRRTVYRRLDESILAHSTPPREFQKAAQELRLETYTRAVGNALSLDDADVAKLVGAAIQIEKRRAALHGLDEPTRRAVAITSTPAEQEPPSPWLAESLARWRDSDLYRADIEAAGRNEGL